MHTAKTRLAPPSMPQDFFFDLATVPLPRGRRFIDAEPRYAKPGTKRKGSARGPAKAPKTRSKFAKTSFGKKMFSGPQRDQAAVDEARGIFRLYGSRRVQQLPVAAASSSPQPEFEDAFPTMEYEIEDVPVRPKGPRRPKAEVFSLYDKWTALLPTLEEPFVSRAVGQPCEDCLSSRVYRVVCVFLTRASELLCIAPWVMAHSLWRRLRGSQHQGMCACPSAGIPRQQRTVPLWALCWRLRVFVRPPGHVPLRWRTLRALRSGYGRWTPRSTQGPRISTKEPGCECGGRAVSGSA